MCFGGCLEPIAIPTAIATVTIRDPVSHPTKHHAIASTVHSPYTSTHPPGKCCANAPGADRGSSAFGPREALSDLVPYGCGSWHQGGPGWRVLRYRVDGRAPGEKQPMPMFGARSARNMCEQANVLPGGRTCSDLALLRSGLSLREHFE